MIRTPLNLAPIKSSHTVLLEAIPMLSMDDFMQTILDSVTASLRVVSLFGVASPHLETTTLYVALADDEQNQLFVGRTEVKGDSFPSLTPRCPQVHLFEREIAEQFGLIPLGHPWLKPLRYHHAWTARDAWGRDRKQTVLPAVGDFYRVEGEQAHEVAVGPVHAGVIEPGHFRFQCHGEQVFHLEIALGFQHRGIEQAMVGGPTKRSLPYAETLAGDTTIAHAASYCQIIEALGNCRKTARAEALSSIALELERLANHVGDLGALSGDVGFLPAASFCGRIRGEFLNMTALLCGNRFGRGLLQPGGVAFDMDEDRVAILLHQLAVAERDTTIAVELLWGTQSVMARFVGAGPLPRQMAVDMGIVGPAARASGLTRDVRCDQPSGIFRLAQIPVSTCDSGDVFGRAFVRWLEIQRSLAFIREQLQSIPTGAPLTRFDALSPNRLAISLNEGWRGEVCHVALTDEQSRFSRYKIVDPSFHNWLGLAYAMRNQEISDFPLCNKSFNLSYCGHDL